VAVGNSGHSAQNAIAFGAEIEHIKCSGKHLAGDKQRDEKQINFLHRYRIKD